MPTNRDLTGPPRVVIAALSHDPGLQAARILAARGVPVIGLTTDLKHYCCRTKVCEEIILALSKDEYVATLESLGSRLTTKAVLLPTSDDLVELISKNRARLEPWYHVLLPEPGVVEMMMDKVAFYAFAEERGFPIPKTRYLRTRASAEKAAAEFRFPVVVKPPNRAGQWSQHTTLKVLKVDSPGELLHFYDEKKHWADTLIAQEWIEGPDANLVSCNFYFDGDSQPLATFVSRKLRQWPPGAGDSSLGEECRDDEILAETIRLGRSVGYRGLGYVEMKRDERTGENFIIEPNVGRPTGRSAIAEAGGVELLYTAYCDAIGWPLPANRDQTYGQARWIYLRKDFQAALYYWLHNELTLREWFQSWRGKKAFALFSWRDSAPFFGDLARVIRIGLSPSRLRRRRRTRSRITEES